MQYHETAALYVEKTAKVNQEKKIVFLIGDSIRMGYCGYAKEMLADVADVYYPDDNCRYVQYTYVCLQNWKAMFEDPEKVDVIVWNNGHWDIAHFDNDTESLNSIEIYQKGLLRILKRLRDYFPNAKIVFTTTLPVNPANPENWFNFRSNAEIRAYNAAAADVLAKEGVQIDDAFSLYENEPASFFSDYCHLTEEGYQRYAAHICEIVRELL